MTDRFRVVPAAYVVFRRVAPTGEGEVLLQLRRGTGYLDHRTAGNHDRIDERVDFFFAVRRWGGEPRLVEPDKVAELGWFALDALPEPVVPHERFVLDGLRSGGLPPVVTFGFPGGAA